MVKCSLVNHFVSVARKGSSVRNSGVWIRGVPLYTIIVAVALAYS